MPCKHHNNEHIKHVQWCHEAHTVLHFVCTTHIFTKENIYTHWYTTEIKTVLAKIPNTVTRLNTITKS